MALPASDPTIPQPGTLVRLTFYPHPTYRRYTRFVEHRELEIVSAGTNPEGRPFVIAICEGSKSTVFADAAGRFPQFKLAADPIQHVDWPTGYYDALEFIPPDRRYMKPSDVFSAGYARGVKDRARLGLKQCRESVMIESNSPPLNMPSSKVIGTFDITLERKR
jgi:hypothetical protein